MVVYLDRVAVLVTQATVSTRPDPTMVAGTRDELKEAEWVFVDAAVDAALRDEIDRQLKREAQ